MGEARSRAAGEREGTRMLVLNCGGAPGCWRLHNSDFLKAHVLCLQEVGMSPTEWQGFAKAARRKGYFAYYTPGQVAQGRWGRDRFCGGIAFLVHTSVKHTTASSCQRRDNQIRKGWGVLRGCW